MIRLTRNRILFSFVVLLFIGITSLFMFSSQTEKYAAEQVGGISPAESDAASQKKSVPALGADEAEWQAFMENSDDYDTSLDISDISDLSVAARIKEELKELELIASGQHPDYPPAPRREDFSSELDHLKAYLEFYEQKVLEAAGTEYQEAFESVVESTKKSIELEKKLIARANNPKMQEGWWEAKRAELIRENAWVSGLNALSVEEQMFYVKHIEPNIQPTGELSFSDEVLDAMLEDWTLSKASEFAPDASVGVPLPPDPNVPIGTIPFPQEISRVHDVMRQKYPDQFTYQDGEVREVISALLPSEASRQSFVEREVALQKEYAALLEARIKAMPPGERKQAIATARQSLRQQWDRDFTNAVLKQVQQSNK